MALILGGLLFTITAKPTLAQTAPDLEGWVFDDNNRSSWDIFWTCLATIFACTWTSLHVHTLRRDQSSMLFPYIKFAFFVGAILAPEFMAGLACEEHRDVCSISRRCNVAFDNLERRESSSSDASAERRSQSRANRWGTIQAFCVRMNGVILQTKDSWTFQVDYQNVVPLIEAGVIEPSHLRIPDIQTRSKADSFAKGFALLQSFWVMCNIIARAVYQMPVSPLEISTVAYVVCAVISYAFWWHKPKDMETPIIIHLPYSRDNEGFPPEVAVVLDRSNQIWVRVPDSVVEDSTPGELFMIPWRIVLRIFTLMNLRTSGLDVKKIHEVGLFGGLPHQTTDDARDQISQTANPSTDSSQGRKYTGTEERTVAAQFAIISFFFFIGIVFCAIHLAAWNFEFPTKAEQISWRIFSLVALSLAWPMYLPRAWACLSKWRKLEDKNQLLTRPISNPRVVPITWWLFTVYSMARWGCIVLMFISLRALPPGSYTTIEWLSTIPHI